MKKTFGAFISEKQYTLRGFAKQIGISPVYASNIENSVRPAPSYSILKRITKVLVLDDDNKAKMFDLAAQSKNSSTLAYDLAEYINQNNSAYKTIRTAAKYNADEKDWQKFAEYISKKYF